MSKLKVILSSGSVPWLGIKQALKYSVEVGYDGLEILPTRIIVKEIEDAILLYGQDKWSKVFSNLDLIKSIHQSWRLDIGLDKEYKINFIQSLFFTIIRYLFFPAPEKSGKIIKTLSDELNAPVIVHDISSRWTDYKAEFAGGILYEIIGTKIRTPIQVKKWLKNRKHKIVVDTRDDQSLLWAQGNRFKDWKSFWKWIGIQNIGGVQITLIGRKGLEKIFTGKQSMIKEQLLWLRKHNWQGAITVEVNPLMLLFFNGGKLRKGFQKIADFIKEST